jgi:Flp pilus assembly protein TadG
MRIRGISLPLAARPAGQTMTEFAMGATVFLLLMFGIMEMAMAVNAYSNVCTAAREAARYAIVHSPTSLGSPCSSGTCTSTELQSVCTAIQQQAVDYAPFLSQGGGGCTTGDINVSFTNPTNAASDYAVVVINHTYPLNIPFMSAVNLNLEASSKILVSQ